MEYRPYQKECIDKINELGSGRVLAALTTGLGKTVIASGIERKGRILFLSHRDELVRQPQKYYDCSFGIEKAETSSNGEDVISASVQTLSKDNRLQKFSPDDFDTIIVDEAHHAAAPTYRKILDYFSGARLVLGLTATPKRGDGIRLTDVFDEIIYEKDLRWGIENGYLSRIRCKQIFADFSLQGVKKTAGDYNQGELEEVLAQQQVMFAAAKAYREYCWDSNRHTLIYCVTRKICFSLQESIRKLIPAEKAETIQVLTGETDADERKSILNGFQDGSVRCIINCMVLTEGVDLPITDAIINMRPTCNDSLFSQMVGRGTRLYEGKDYCLVIDILPSDKEHYRGLCTAPTLFGIEPEFLPPTQRERLDENEDLLTLCDELQQNCVSIIDQMELVVRNIEDFLTEKESLIQANRNNFRALAKALSAGNDIDDGIDFGDLYVERTADESKYFRIKPSFYEEIYISKPDILDNVTVDFRLGGNGEPVRRYVGEMKLDDAIELIRRYCELQPSYQSYSWSHSAKKVWEEQSCTGKQLKKIKQLYRKYGITDDDLESISKFEASQLIDLRMAMKEQEGYLKNIRITSHTSAKKAKQRREEFEDQIQKESEQIEQGKKDFEGFLQIINKRYDQMESRRKAQEEKWKEGTITVKSDIYCSSGSASDAQLSYIISLQHIAERHGFILPTPLIDHETSKYEASFLIAFLKMLEDAEPPIGKRIRIDTEDIKNALKKSREGKSGRYEIRYHMDSE